MIHRSNWLKYFIELYTGKSPSKKNFFESCKSLLQSFPPPSDEPNFVTSIRKDLLPKFCDVDPNERRYFFCQSWIRKSGFIIPVLICLIMGSKVSEEEEEKQKGTKEGEKGKQKEEEEEKEEGGRPKKMFLDFLERSCLQFDMRGNCEKLGETEYFVSAGEMKSGDPQRALKQLRLFLSTKALVVYLHAPTKVKSVKAMGISITPPSSRPFGIRTFSSSYKNILFRETDDLHVAYSLKSLSC